MEGVSRGYVEAIASQAGLGYSKPEFDYGVDGTFSDITIREDGRRFDNGYKIDFQLKSTGNFKINKDEVIYDLEVKNYNDLIEDKVGTQRILILYLMPKEEEINNWIIVNEETTTNIDKSIEYKYNTAFNYCAWWYSLRGKPKRKNKDRVRIKIPRNQILTKDSLKSLMEKVKEGEII
ncbi:hypothetical protein DSECCO2_461980 [anaerobic digester metagenome]